MIRAFILLLTAHMLADYVLQWPALITAKKQEKLWVLIYHVLCFTLLALLFAIVWWTAFNITAIIAAGFLHGFLDFFKIRLTKKYKTLGFHLELADQIIHIFILYVIALQFEPEPLKNLIALPSWLFNVYKSPQLYQVALYVSALAFILRGGTSLIRALLARIQLFRINSADPADFEKNLPVSAKEFNVGRLIGNLERILILFFVLLNNYSAIGFVIAAKSIARFKDLDKRDFAEYYLVGTLASTLIALITGKLLVYLNSLI